MHTSWCFLCIDAAIYYKRRETGSKRRRQHAILPSKCIKESEKSADDWIWQHRHHLIPASAKEGEYNEPRRYTQQHIGLLLWRRRIRLCCCHTTHSVNCRWWHTHTSNSAQRYRNEEKEEKEFWLLLHSHHTSVQSQGEIKAKDPSLLVFILHIHLDVHRFIAPLTKHQRHKLSSQRATAILRFFGKCVAKSKPVSSQLYIIRPESPTPKSIYTLTIRTRRFLYYY